MILPTKKEMAQAIISEMLAMRGEGRYNDKSLVTRILGVMGLPYAIDGNPVAFCASTVCFCAMKFLAVCNDEQLTEENAVSILKKYRGTVDQLYFHTSASVSEMVRMNPNIWLSVDDIGDDVSILPGWAICYLWPGTSDHHIGIVVADHGDTFETVEGNTSDAHGHTGMIAGKSRSWSGVWGFLKLC